MTHFLSYEEVEKNSVTILFKPRLQTKHVIVSKSYLKVPFASFFAFALQKAKKVIHLKIGKKWVRPHGPQCHRPAADF